MTDIVQSMRSSQPQPQAVHERPKPTSHVEMVTVLKDLEKQMLEAAGRLEFELAATLRDEIRELKKKGT